MLQKKLRDHDFNIIDISLINSVSYFNLNLILTLNFTNNLFFKQNESIK